MKTAFSIIVISTLAVGLCVRCSEPVHQCGLDIQCGPGDRLLGISPPGTSQGANNDTQNPTTTVTDAATLCTPVVVQPADGGCAVSFNNDILQKMFGATGTLHCSKAGCHDSTGGVNPLIDVTQPQMTYDNLYNAPTNISYINPCSTDPTQSSLLGNVAFPATQGSHMPQDDTTGALPAAADLATLTTWIKCGSPFN